MRPDAPAAGAGPGDAPPPEPGDSCGPIAMIGGGRMALALAEGFCRTGRTTGDRMTVCDPDAVARERLAAAVPGVRFVPTPAAAAAAARIVFLAVKPQQAAEACGDARLGLRADATIVSIVAGLTTDSLGALLGSRRIIRVMPNTPCLVGQGVSAWCATPEVPAADRHEIVRLLTSVGHVHEVDESLMDAVTAVSGSGPAYVFLLAEALIEAGVVVGLPADTARDLVVQTLLGSATLLAAGDETPEALRAAVTSPGGTTAAGLAELEAHGLRAAVVDAVRAATERSRELGRS